jgi:DNA primase
MDEQGLRQILTLMGATNFKSVGSNLMCSCPFAPYAHKNGTDKYPSFSIATSSYGTSKWQCFTCKRSGKKTISLLYALKDYTGSWNDTLHEMIKDAEQKSFISRIKKMPSYSQVISRNKKIIAQKAVDDYFVQGYEAKFDIKDYQDILEEIPQYALDRGITIDQARKWKIGFHKKMTPVRLFFTILDEWGKMVGWSGRMIGDGHPKYYHVKYMKKEKYLYGEHLIDRDNRTGYLMEGFMDVLNLDRIGLRNCVAIMGSSMSPMQVEKCVKFFDRVIIFPHDDLPGEEMAKGCKDLLSKAGIDAIIAPIIPFERNFDGFLRNPKDPGEYLKSDLDWSFDVIGRQIRERETKAVGEKKEKA